MRVFAPMLWLLVTFSLYGEVLRFGPDAPVAPNEYADPGRAVYNSAIATDGDGYLAVWGDNRRGTSAIYAARLTAGGTLLDPAGIHLGEGYYAEVIWTGRAYVVAWATREAVNVAMIERDGTVSQRRFLTAGVAFARPALATNGNTIGVATTEGRLFILDLTLDVRATRNIASAARMENSVSVAAREGQYLIACINAAGVTTRTVTDSGVVSTPNQIEESTGAYMVSAASDGSAYLVLWSTQVDGLRGQRISAENQEVGNAVTLVNGAGGNPVPRAESPSVVWRDGEYLAVYYFGGAFGQDQQLIALRISAAGAVIGPAMPFGKARGIERPNLAAKNDGRGAVIWIDTARRVRVGLFDDVSLASGLAIHKEVSAASAAREQSHPAIVAVERTAVTAWSERAVGVQQIRIARLGGQPMVVADALPEFLDVVYDGDTVSVIWTTKDSGELFVRRYTRALGAIDAQPYRVSLGAHAIVEAAAAGNGVIAFTWRYRSSNELLLTRLTPSGNTLAAASLRLNSAVANAADRDSVLVWDGSEFVAFWRHEYSASGMDVPTGSLHESIFAARVTPEGVRENANPVKLHEVTGTSIYSLRAVSNGQRDTVIAWQESSPGLITYVARTDGRAAVTRRQVAADNEPPYSRLAAIAMHRNGSVDVYWYDATEPALTASIRAVRLTRGLVQQGETYTTAEFPITNVPSDPAEVVFNASFDATVVGNGAVFVYERRGDRDAGDVSRLFLRSERGPTSRRRSVR